MHHRNVLWNSCGWYDLSDIEKNRLVMTKKRDKFDENLRNPKQTLKSKGTQGVTQFFIAGSNLHK